MTTWNQAVYIDLFIIPEIEHLIKNKIIVQIYQFQLVVGAFPNLPHCKCHSMMENV